MAEEWAEDGHKQWKDEEEQRIAAVGTLLVVEQRVKDHNTKLTEVGREKKSVEAELAGAKRQAEDQRQQLHKTKDQIAIAKEQIEVPKKKSADAEEVFKRFEEDGYDVGVKETKESIRAQITDVYRGYCI